MINSKAEISGAERCRDQILAEIVVVSIVRSVRVPVDVRRKREERAEISAKLRRPKCQKIFEPLAEQRQGNQIPRYQIFGMLWQLGNFSAHNLRNQLGGLLQTPPWALDDTCFRLLIVFPRVESNVSLKGEK